MQSEIADPYGVLGLPRSANVDDLKKAYRKLSLAWHPDRHSSGSDAQRTEAERRFKLINAAYVAIGEILRTREAQDAAAEAAVAARSDAKVEAIRSVVASAALRTIPNVPRHIYWRVVNMVEGLLLDTIAVGDQAFLFGFDTAVREALYVAGLGFDSREDAIKVLDAAADELQWHGKGADPATWQELLRPLEQAMHPAKPAPARPAPAPAVTVTMEQLLRPEQEWRVAQVLLAALFLIMLLPPLPLAAGVRFPLLLADLAALAYVTFGARRA